MFNWHRGAYEIMAALILRWMHFPVSCRRMLSPIGIVFLGEMRNMEQSEDVWAHVMKNENVSRQVLSLKLRQELNGYMEDNDLMKDCRETWSRIIGKRDEATMGSIDDDA